MQKLPLSSRSRRAGHGKSALATPANQPPEISSSDFRISVPLASVRPIFEKGVSG